MHESRVTQLGYLGIDVSDLAAWEVQVHHAASVWGHRAQTATPLLEAGQPA